jgi:Gly-Xaa carboxypeptidase
MGRQYIDLIFAVNHRVNIGDEPEDVWERITALAKPVAKKYNLTLHAFDGTKEAAKSISLSPSDTTMRAAPVTPTNANKNSPYRILAATTRALYGEDIVVSPGWMTGNTDTRYYWDLTKHIFRFGPGYDPADKQGLGNIHTVNERVSIVNHLGMVKWFTLFVRNMDEADLED